MQGDFTRDTRSRAAADNVRAVLLQQGRQLLDADWNEQTGLTADRMERLARDVIGRQGAPRHDAGFAITPVAGGFTIGAGRLYADGLAVENPEPVAYADQVRAGLLPAFDVAVPDGAEALVYLEALLAAATPTSDPALAEPGLAGADTVVREQVAWTVRLTPLASIPMARDALITALGRGDPVTIPAWAETTGGLAADVETEAEATDPGPCEMPPTAGYRDQFNRLYRIAIHDGGAPGTATYKWTEDAAVEAGLRAEGAGFVVDLPLDRAAMFLPGTVVEVIDGDAERAGRPGPVGRITSAVGAPLAIDGVPASALGAAVRIRRWAAAPVPVPAGLAWQSLSRGIKIRFSDGAYVAGAEWTVPARNLTGDILWPPRQRPDFTAPSPVAGEGPVPFYLPSEGRRRYAALALVRRLGATVAVVSDLRDVFPPLTDLTADDVRYDDVGGALGADTVQEAIEALASRGGGDCCTLTARPGAGWQRIFDEIPVGGHVTVCFGVGNYKLTEPVTIRGRGHVRLVGAGSGTKIWCVGSTTALRFEDCASLGVEGLVIAAERHAPPLPPRPTSAIAAALEAIGCGPVDIRRTTLISSGRRLRQAACLRVESPAVPTRGGGGDVTIGDCDIVCGDLGIGILVINGATVRIRDNRIRPRAEPAWTTLRRWQDDPQMQAALGRTLFSHAIDDGGSRSLPATRADGRAFVETRIDYRTARIRFFTSPLLDKGTFARLRDMHQLSHGARLTDSRRVRLALRDLVGNVDWTGSGNVVVGADPFDGFRPVRDAVRETAAPLVHAGIVVGGSSARDIVVSGNSVAGAIEGIRIATSGGGTRPAVDKVRLEGNTVRLRVALVDLVRRGVFVGNVGRAWIIDNDIAYETADLPDDARLGAARRREIDRLYAEGIRIHGALGPHVLVRGNIVRRCATGVAVVAGTGSVTSTPSWMVSDSMVEGARTAYALDRRVRSRDNVG